MSDQGQVFIKDTGVYLYTHLGASKLVYDVQKAMVIGKKYRWDQPDYLTRIIFDCMEEGALEKDCGFGIGIREYGDIWRLIIVDCKSQKITVRDCDNVVYEGSFKEFISVRISDNG